MKAVILAAVATTALLASPAAAQDYVRKTNGDIQFANYPLESLKRGEEGTVGIRVRLDIKGRLRSCEVVKSSGFAALDAASCDLLIANARMKPFLDPNGRKVEKEADGQVVWKLPADRQARIADASLPVGPAPTGSKARLARAGEKVICRTLTDTGSLVRRTKTCLTSGEWKRQHSFAQEELQDMKPKFLPGGP